MTANAVGVVVGAVLSVTPAGRLLDWLDTRLG
jgi:hypothetical protein